MDQIIIIAADSILLLPDPVSKTNEVKSRTQIMLSAIYSCHRHNRLEFTTKNMSKVHVESLLVISFLCEADYLQTKTAVTYKRNQKLRMTDK
jgi:hypothetical protein